MGTATVTLNGTQTTLDGYNSAWQSTHWTLQQYTDLEDMFFRVSTGQHKLSISCTGTTTADEPGVNSTLFKLESVVIL